MTIRSKFSIRKLSVGVASILIGATLLLAPSVNAQEAPAETPQTETVTETPPRMTQVEITHRATTQDGFQDTEEPIYSDEGNPDHSINVTPGVPVTVEAPTWGLYRGLPARIENHNWRNLSNTTRVTFIPDESTSYHTINYDVVNSAHRGLIGKVENKPDVQLYRDPEATAPAEDVEELEFSEPSSHSLPSTVYDRDGHIYDAVGETTYSRDTPNYYLGQRDDIHVVHYRERVQTLKPTDPPKRELEPNAVITRYQYEDGRDIEAPTVGDAFGEMKDFEGTRLVYDVVSPENGVQIKTYYYTATATSKSVETPPTLDLPAKVVTRYINEDMEEIAETQVGDTAGDNFDVRGYYFDRTQRDSEDPNIVTHVYHPLYTPNPDPQFPEQPAPDEPRDHVEDPNVAPQTQGSGSTETVGSQTPGSGSTETVGSQTPGNSSTETVVPQVPSNTPGSGSTENVGSQTPGHGSTETVTPQTPSNDSTETVAPQTPGNQTPGSSTENVVPQTPGTSSTETVTPQTPGNQTPGSSTENVAPQTPSNGSTENVGSQTPGNQTPGNGSTENVGPQTPGNGSTETMTPQTSSNGSTENVGPQTPGHGSTETPDTTTPSSSTETVAPQTPGSGSTDTVGSQTPGSDSTETVAPQTPGNGSTDNVGSQTPGNSPTKTPDTTTSGGGSTGTSGNTAPQTPGSGSTENVGSQTPVNSSTETVVPQTPSNGSTETVVPQTPDNSSAETPNTTTPTNPQPETPSGVNPSEMPDTTTRPKPETPLGHPGFDVQVSAKGPVLIQEDLPELVVTEKGESAKADELPELVVTEKGESIKADELPELVVTDKGESTSQEDLPELVVTDKGESTSHELPELVVTDKGEGTTQEDLPELVVTEKGESTKADSLPELVVTENGEIFTLYRTEGPQGQPFAYGRVEALVQPDLDPLTLNNPSDMMNEPLVCAKGQPAVQDALPELIVPDTEQPASQEPSELQSEQPTVSEGESRSAQPDATNEKPYAKPTVLSGASPLPHTGESDFYLLPLSFAFLGLGIYVLRKP